MAVRGASVISPLSVEAFPVGCKSHRKPAGLAGRSAPRSLDHPIVEFARHLRLCGRGIFLEVADDLVTALEQMQGSGVELRSGRVDVPLTADIFLCERPPSGSYEQR